MKRLEGKTALVVGGGTGLGAGVVRRFVREGARVAVAGVDVVKSTYTQHRSPNIGGYAAAKALVAELGNEGARLVAIEADVTSKKQVEAMIAKTVETFGRVDLVVNCAGVITSGTVAKLTEEEWDFIFDTNAKGTFLVGQAAAAQMLKQGGGKIINFSSIAGKEGYAGLAHYCASKFAVIGFTQALAKELIKDNITVNAICPGVIATQMWTMLRQDFAQPGEGEEQSFLRNVKGFIPQGVPQTAEDMAEGVMYFAVSDHVTGQSINIDGGASMH